VTLVNKINWRRTTHVYDVHLDNKIYVVRKETSSYYGEGEFRYTVHGGGNRRDTICDENGSTHKRVMKFFHTMEIDNDKS
jgi:hypothetical protein